MRSPQHRSSYAWFGSKRGRLVLFVLFLVSLSLDLEMLLTPLLTRLRILHPHGWTALIFAFEAIFEIALMAGATILWLLMLFHCWTVPGRSIFGRFFWGALFFFGAWFTSQAYYLFSFRRRNVLGNSC